MLDQKYAQTLSDEDKLRKYFRKLEAEGVADRSEIIRLIRINRKLLNGLTWMKKSALTDVLAACVTELPE